MFHQVKQLKLKIMEQIKLLPSHEDTMIGRMLRDLSFLSNIEVRLKGTDLENWERKEWEQIKTASTHDLKDAIEHIKINESFFNEILSLYKLSVTIFLVRYFKDYL